MSARSVLLIAEDEPVIADLIDITLRDAGYQVVVVESGKAAIAELEAEPQRFVGLITDVRMIDVDGWEVARRARELIPDMAVVYMSGDSAGQWPARGVTHSIMIEKPFALGQVVIAISSLLTRD